MEMIKQLQVETAPGVEPRIAKTPLLSNLNAKPFPTLSQAKEEKTVCLPSREIDKMSFAQPTDNEGK